MKKCNECGYTTSEEVDVCPNCGNALVEVQSVNQGVNETSNESGIVGFIDKIGKFTGIILLILALVGIMSGTAIAKILIGVIVLAGCIFCLNRKYGLKGFTIAALVLAALCILNGVSQAGKIGLFAKQEIEVKEEIIDDSSDDKELMQEDVEENSDVQTDVEEIEVEEAEEEISEEDVAFEEIEEAIDELEEELEEVVGDPNAVNPELKEYLDSYEAFMNEYVDFMKKYYADPSNIVNLLSDYTEIMAKYDEFSSKIDSYDPDTMSTADAMYYLEVIGRVNQNLLSIMNN